MKMLRVLAWVGIGIAAVTTLSLVLGLPVMWLWNWLMPALFGLKVITYLQAVGLLVLCHLLFKGHTVGHRHREAGRRRWDRFAKRVQSSMEEPDPSTTERV